MSSAMLRTVSSGRIWAAAGFGSHAAAAPDRRSCAAGCEAGEPVIAELRQGDPVEIRFRLAGGDGER